MDTVIKEVEDIFKKENNARCFYCRAKLTSEDELLPKIDYKETEIMNLNQQIQKLEGVIQALKQELVEKNKKL